MKAQIVKVVSGNLIVQIGKSFLKCDIRGSVKKSTKFLVGDFVEVEENKFSDGRYIITKVYPRKNSLVRPPLANLDQLFIVIANKPPTDFLLVDKLIIYCIQNNITPYLIINKWDIANSKEIESIKSQYDNVVKEVLMASAKDGRGINAIKNLLKNNLSAFAGQSAVGKSSILNSICPHLTLQTNELSRKIDRGKHTTRHTEIYLLEDDIKIADTPGFSMLELDINLNPEDLNGYYIDFDRYSNCQYTNCTHINVKPKECGVVRAVENKEISSHRYTRYVQLYNILKDKWRKKYD